MKAFSRVALVALLVLVLAPALQAQGGGQRPANLPVSNEERIDMATFKDPLPPNDHVWIQQMTEIQVRDAIKAGKTNVLIPTGSVETNGPWLTTNKHNDVLRVAAESIARRMDDMLIAPIVPVEACDPARATSPGRMCLSPAVYKGVVHDFANSLRAQGFKNFFIVGDSGGNTRPDSAVAADLMAEWKGTGARAFYVPEYYDYDEILTYENEHMNTPETRYSDRFHDNYYITTMIMVGDPEAANYSGRVKIGETKTNGFSVAPVEKAKWHGRQLIEFRTDATVAAIKQDLAKTTTNDK